MNAIKIHTHLESDTIRIPELRPMIGKDVEITIREEVPEEYKSLADALKSFDHVPVDLDALAELREISKI